MKPAMRWWIGLSLGLVACLAVAAMPVARHDGEDEAGSPQQKKAAAKAKNAAKQAAAKQAAAQGRAFDETKPVTMTPDLISLELTFRDHPTMPADYEADVSVSNGQVVGTRITQGAPASKAEDRSFMLRVTPKAQAQLQKKKGQGPWEGIVQVDIDAPPTATATVKTAGTSFEIPLDGWKDDTVRTYLDGLVRVRRVPGSARLTGPDTEDDYPAIARDPKGGAWLAYVEYQPERFRLNQQPTPDQFDAMLVPTNNGDRIRLRRYHNNAWEPPIDVTGKKLDVWRPSIALDGEGAVWVAWAQQVDGNWDIYARRYRPEGNGTWSETVRVTSAPGTDFHVVAATDGEGKVNLAWQGFRDGNFDILIARQDGGKFTGESRLSNSPANDWSPSIVADSRGKVHVAWDTYDKGNYDIRLRTIGLDKIHDVADSSRFEARPCLAADSSGRVWVAYEEGDEQWGKDYSTNQFERIPFDKNPGFALYINRTVRLKCLDGDGTTWMQPTAALDKSLGNFKGRKLSLPRLAFDDSGRLWMTFRHHPLGSNAGEAWNSTAMVLGGKGWSAPIPVPGSTSILDSRPALLAVPGGLLHVGSSDYRTSTATRGQADITAVILPPTTEANAGEIALSPASARPDSTLTAVHPDEATDVARMRAYRIEAGGKSLRLLRGEFHRHTELSAHNDGDGTLEDSWRYALDAGSLDWMGNADHMNGSNFEFMWWYVQKMTDLFHNAPAFLPMHTYERSAVYPNGHRNVMFARRGIRPLPFGTLAGTAEKGSPDTKVLYAYLKHFGGLCASHTSATNMGTDWRDNDPEVEPIVEIYQGHRHNYEHLGAPRAPSPERQIGGYEPAGYIWNALEKGYKLGFQSSSDHISTHWSYAIALAEDTSRRAIVEAFKKRHCYAATDNILLDVRSGDHLMGDTFALPAGQRPTLQVRVEGTAPISKLHVIRDNKYMLSTEPKTKTVSFRYTDEDQALEPGKVHYYYVRIEQADGNLAWASPMWITTAK